MEEYKEAQCNVPGAEVSEPKTGKNIEMIIWQTPRG